MRVYCSTYKFNVVNKHRKIFNLSTAPIWRTFSLILYSWEDNGIDCRLPALFFNNTIQLINSWDSPPITELCCKRLSFIKRH